MSPKYIAFTSLSNINVHILLKFICPFTGNGADKVRRKGKYQDSIQSSTTRDTQDTTWESDKHKKT